MFQEFTAYALKKWHMAHPDITIFYQWTNKDWMYWDWLLNR